MNPFNIFVIFYATAFLMEMLEKWEYPAFSWAALGLVALLVFTRITRLKFLLFLLLTTSYFVWFRIPDVANHVNIILFINLTLIIGLIYSYFQPVRDPNRHHYFELMLPLLRLSLIIVYFLAGFHKLNQDFFNPQSSCAAGLFLDLISIITTRLWGVPLLVWFTALGLIVLWQIFKNKIRIFRHPALSLGILAGTISISFGILLLLRANLELLFALVPWIVLLTIIIVVAWEIFGSLLLFIPRWQLPIMVFSWLMHMILAPIGFVDFGALGFALLLCFIPQNYYQLLAQHNYIRLSKWKLERAQIYFLINIFGSMLAGINYYFFPVFEIKITTGILLNLAAIIFIYPLISQVWLSRKPRWQWQGVTIFNRHTPKLMLLLPVLLLSFGMTSYLGLRTAGNFSMFSNLRTEGEVSNHLLLGSNPWKIWHYQEDVVHFLAIDDQKAKIGNHYHSLQGNFLPLVEFKKLIYLWTKAGKTIPLKFIYQGTTYDTPNITQDPIWRTEKRNWEMKLLDFRVITSEQPNLCRW